MNKHTKIIKLLTHPTIGRKEKNLVGLDDKALGRIVNLESKKIKAIREEKAREYAMLTVRMGEQKERQREEARIEKIRTDRALLRAKREAAERIPTLRFVNRGFVPPAKIGVITTEMKERIEITTDLRDFDQAVEDAKLDIRSNGWSKEREEAGRQAVIRRSTYMASLPSEMREKLELERYLAKTERNVTGSSSFQK